MVSTFSRKDQNYKNDDLNQPSKEGRFGKYGGQYVPETLMPALFELETAASNAWKDKLFVEELNHLLKTYVGRETPLYEAKRLTEHYKTKLATPRIWLKREDLNHTGAHKINNALGQALLAIRMGKKMNNRRNWSRSAWSCYCYCLCEIWLEMYYLHGC